jgi:hypothetical protein
MKETYNNPEEIIDLVRAFESCTLDRGLWTHHAHMTVALWYLIRRQKEEATRLIREGIKRYNEACGVVTTKDNGYHETVTLFYIWLVDNFVKRLDETHSIVEIANSLIKAHGDKTLPLKYYSRERLMSWEARTRWVEPDLSPLAQIEVSGETS